VKLKHPFEFQGQTITALSFRRPKARDLLLAEKQVQSRSEVEISIYLAAHLAEVDEKLIHELDAVDYFEIARVIEGFTKEEAGEA